LIEKETIVDVKNTFICYLHHLICSKKLFIIFLSQFLLTLYANKLEAMNKSYTKSDLEQIIGLQQESLQALQKALGNLRHQNERLERSNQKLRKKISEYE
jgi:hypothetical protein